ncbi:MAG: hypothetical protein ACQXXG_08860 [Candidatus Bathyarchaeia archaeon]|jgi:hypothetical protein
MLSKAVPEKRNNGPSKRINVGDVVYVRYYDSVLFKDALVTHLFKPIVRETIGWLDYENAEYIRLVWERYAEPIIGEESRIRTTGLAIRKSDVIEMRKLA